MRYHPLTSDDRAQMLAKIGAPDIDALFRDVPKSAVVPLSAFDLTDTKGELEVDRADVAHGGEEHGGGQRAVLLRRRRVQASCSRRRSII